MEHNIHRLNKIFVRSYELTGLFNKTLTYTDTINLKRRIIEISLIFIHILDYNERHIIFITHLKIYSAKVNPTL